jgi:hypothetical protein
MHRGDPRVLKRRNRLDRFGVTLLHTHFPMAEDEVMVESCDNEARTLTMQVQSADVLALPSLKPTAWRLSDDKVMMGCYLACVVRNGSHKPNVHTTR